MAGSHRGREGGCVAEARDRGKVYLNVCLIDCDSRETLDELLASVAIDRYVIRRVSERAVLVDGVQRVQLGRALARLGRPFRIVDAAQSPPSGLTIEPRR